MGYLELPAERKLETRPIELRLVPFPPSLVSPLSQEFRSCGSIPILEQEVLRQSRA